MKPSFFTGMFSCLSLILFSSSVLAASTGIQMLPPMQSNDITQPCKERADAAPYPLEGDKILTWDGKNSIKCTVGVTANSTGLFVGTATAGGQFTLGATNSAAEGAQINFRGAGVYGDWMQDVYADNLRLVANTASANQVQIFNYHSTGVASLYVEGDIGAGVTAPAAKLDIAGGIKMADDNVNCTVAKAGTVRFRDGRFQGCNGTAWIALGVTRFGDVATGTISAGCNDAAVACSDPWACTAAGSVAYAERLLRWVNTCGARFCTAKGMGYQTGKVSEYYNGIAVVDCW